MSRPKKIMLGTLAGLLVMLAVLFVLLLSFDWNRAKPWIESRVTETTGREFVIDGDLSLGWRAPDGETGWRAWIPWPRLNAHEVRFANPSWAEEPWMAQVGQLSFSLSPLPLLRRRIVIPSLFLDQPRLVLERRQDGRHNWRFGTGDQSDWQFELQRLVLSRGQLHVSDDIRNAELRADIDTLDGKDGRGYRLGWRLEGELDGVPLQGSGRAGSVLSLQRKGVEFPVEATLHLGKTRIDAKGAITDPGAPSALNLQVKVAGISMAQLYPLTGFVLPETKPYSTEGRLIGSLDPDGSDWSYEKFSGRMGDSDVAGTLHYRSRDTRPLVEGTVVSDLLKFNDLSPLIGVDSDESKARRGAKVKQPADKVLPVEPFQRERWTKVDADVQFSGNKVVRQHELPVDNVVTRIRLKDGVLSLAPLKFGIAGGNVVSNLRLDGNRKPVEGELRLTARHMQLRELFPDMELMDASLGEINADAAITARGNSVAALFGSANGELKAVISQGSVSKLLLEQMGLNIGSIVLTEMFGDKQVQINCAVADFVLDDGVMRTNTFVVDTEQAHIAVQGKINLARERLDLTVYPESKGLRLISLRSPLYVKGSFKKADVEVDKGTVALKAGSALALAALGPAAAALLPLVNGGPGEKSKCGTLLAQAREKPVTAHNEGTPASSGK